MAMLPAVIFAVSSCPLLSIQGCPTDTSVQYVIPVCMALHWLPTVARLSFKTLILTYKALYMAWRPAICQTYISTNQLVV